MTAPNPATTDWVPLWPLSPGSAGGGISSIPGEIKMWPGQTLPDQPKYGKWVWADGAIYAVATYPEAAAYIDPAWKTAHGLADPGAGNFRAPDLRGVLPAGMDAMPGGARVNRMTRSVAITICGRAGEEYHTITVAEMPSHSHVVDEHGGHNHQIWGGGRESGADSVLKTDSTYNYREVAALMSQTMDLKLTGITVNNNGGGSSHENLPPTIFVPWIVRLDG